MCDIAVVALASGLAWIDQQPKAPGAASGISNPAKARVLTGAEKPCMAMNSRFGASGVLATVIVMLGIFIAWNQWSARPTSPKGIASTSSPAEPPPSQITSTNRTALAQTGKKYVLEVRGMGVVVGREADEEIWDAIKEKADNHASYVSQNSNDQAGNDSRLSHLEVATVRIPANVTDDSGIVTDVPGR
jgi:hypothetical protein